MTLNEAYWSVLRLLRRPIARWPGEKWCVLCEKRVRRFIPYRNGLQSVPPLIAELAVIGSDVENFECPRCQSHDRERHLFMYMRATGLMKKLRGADVLHFAPEPRLAKCFLQAGPRQYIQADLYPTSQEIRKLDLQKLPFQSRSFDLVLANHVLEHVEDDVAALREIHRVLRPSGRAILQTPFSSALSRRLEDPGIATLNARLHAYGQEDHVRLYGANWAKEFAVHGLRVELGMHEDLLPQVDPCIHGVNSYEPFMQFRRE